LDRLCLDRLCLDEGVESGLHVRLLNSRRKCRRRKQLGL